MKSEGAVLCLAACLVLSGCGQSEEPPGAPSASTPGEYPDVSQWRPSVMPNRQEFTQQEAEAERIRLAELGRPDAAKGRPIPDAVQWVGLADWPEVYVECMTRSGYSATALADGSVEYGEIPESQESARDIVEWECSAQYPTPPSRDGALTSEQLSVLYEYYTQFFVPCATVAGVTWKDPSIPTEAAFKDSMMGNGQAPWVPASIMSWQDPTMAIADPKTDEGREFWKRCPPQPPAEYLNP